MELARLFNQPFGEGTLEEVLSQLIKADVSKEQRVTHHNTGQKALVAAAEQLQPYATEQGGVVHYQRNLGQVSPAVFYSTVALDLLWIERYIGKIDRLKAYVKGDESSQQLFLTLRLSNRVIVQYGLNSLADLKPTFSFDFSSRGYNLEFDDQIQAPLLLNGTVVQISNLTDVLETEDLVELKRVWELLVLSIEGGN